MMEFYFEADSPEPRKDIYAEASEGTELLDNYNAAHLLDEFEAFDLLYDLSKTDMTGLRQIPYVILYGGFHKAQNEQLRRGMANLPQEKWQEIFDTNTMTPEESDTLRRAFFDAKLMD